MSKVDHTTSVVEVNSFVFENLAEMNEGSREDTEEPEIIEQEVYLTSAPSTDVFVSSEINLTENIETVNEAPTDAEIVEAVEDVSATTIDYIAEFELDPEKRQGLISYAETLSPDDQLKLLDMLRVLYGPTPDIVSLDKAVQDTVELAMKSTLLKAKQRSQEARLQEFLRLSQQVQRFMNGSFRDDTFNSLRIDDTIKHINSLEETISILSTSVYQLASRVGLTRYVEPENMPVNIENLVKVLTIVGHSAKSWAITSEFAKDKAIKDKETLDAKDLRIRELAGQVEDMRNLLAKQQASEQAGIINSSAFFRIMNHSGYFIGTVREPGDDGKTFLTRNNVCLTTNADEALTLTNLEDAKAVYDALQYWWKHFVMFRNKFKKVNVRFDSLFVGKTVIRKVEV